VLLRDGLLLHDVVGCQPEPNPNVIKLFVSEPNTFKPSAINRTWSGGSYQEATRAKVMEM
jgi:hypothetical protein